MPSEINTIVAGVDFLGDRWQQEAAWQDTTLQSGAPINTPKTVLFGAGGTSNSGLLSMDNTGVITVLKGGTFILKSRLRFSRVGATGVSNIFTWAEISVNGGVSWNILGSTAGISLDTSADDFVFFDSTPFLLPTGVRLRQRFARSSTGDDSGDLSALVPSAALQALGITTAPSAQLTVFRVVGFPYG